jgi:hypothetical protein
MAQSMGFSLVIKLFNLKNNSWLFAISVGLLLLFFGFKLSTVDAQSVTIYSTRNCDANSVIWCGADSVNDLITKYDNGDGHNTAASIQAIYSYYGITASDVEAMSSASETVESGSVNANGNVYSANNSLVAISAVTAGRENISGSTKVDSGGTILYSRPTSVSFASNSLPAYVVMKNGRFVFAILASCGNPVKATAKIQPAPPAPKPKPVVIPPAPTPTTSATVCSGNTTNINGVGSAAQGGNCSTNTTVVQTPIAPAASGECTSLQVTVDQNSPLVITATANSQTENGAQLSSVIFDFGDGSTTTPATTATTQEHSYATPGNYTISATETFNNGTQIISSSNCQAAVTMASAPNTPVAPPTVSTAVSTVPASNLVNTGPGNIIELFGASVIIGSLTYHAIVVKSYFNRN